MFKTKFYKHLFYVESRLRRRRRCWRLLGYGKPPGTIIRGGNGGDVVGGQGFGGVGGEGAGVNGGGIIPAGGGGGGGGALTDAGGGGGGVTGGGGGGGYYGQGAGGGGILSVGAGSPARCLDSCGGAGGGALGGDDAGGGGGGGSWSGGGQGGQKDYFPTGSISGGDGNDPVTTAIPVNRHYLNNNQPRLMMGESGGSSVCVQAGAGGGIVLLDFDNVAGNGNAILANGASVPQAPPTCEGIYANGTTDQGAGGAGSGGGGQMRLSAGSWADTAVTANGGDGGGGNNTDVYHGGTGGGGGGGGGIWFDGVVGYTGDETNTGGGNPAVPGVTAISVGGGLGGPSMTFERHGAKLHN